jgi:pre-mRNA-processing factor 39
VKALDKAQLDNWTQYLEFEISQGIPERIHLLFERCMIACALYEEFWIKVDNILCSFILCGLIVDVS